MFIGFPLIFCLHSLNSNSDSHVNCANHVYLHLLFLSFYLLYASFDYTKNCFNPIKISFFFFFPSSPPPLSSPTCSHLSHPPSVASEQTGLKEFSSILQGSPPQVDLPAHHIIWPCSHAPCQLTCFAPIQLHRMTHS